MVWYYKQSDDCKLTQREANSLCEGSECDISDKISNYFAMIMTAIFFSPIIPVAIPIAFVGSWMHYVVYKYMILRKHKQPDMLSKTMGTFFANFMPYITLIWAIGFVIYVELMIKVDDLPDEYKKYRA